MTDNESKYWAFLAYSQPDNREHRTESLNVHYRCWGDWLHNALKAFSVPVEFVGQPNGRNEIIPERIQPIFQDTSESSGDANLSPEICQALEKSACLIVVCSPRSALSAHVNEVVRYFKQLGRSQQILPVVIAGEPHASDGNPPEHSPENECFVPALRHPLSSDGTVDTTRRASRHIFVDARHGVAKREILTNDNQSAEADLEMARIQVIALTLGVGFNGLWLREQQRHFFDLIEARQQVQEARHKVEESQRQILEAQSKSLAIQNLPPDVHSQIQEAQNQVQEARTQTRIAEEQLREFENKVQATQVQLEAARERALVSENKVLAAQNLAHEAQSQLEAIQNQIREAQKPPGQPEEIQQQTREAQDKLSDAQQQILEARDQARTAQERSLDLQNKIQDLQTQLETARNQALTDENKVLTAQNLAQETQNQFTEARTQVRELQNIQSQLEAAQQEAQNKFLAAQSQIEEFQSQARSAENQLTEAREQIRTTQSELSEARQQTQAAHGKIQEIENQTRDVQSQIVAAQNRVQNIEERNRQSRRLTKVFALLAVLALLSAGIAASIATRQRKIANQAQVRLAIAATGKFDPTIGGLDSERIRQVLQNIGGADQARNLDQLATWIPQPEIPDALAASTIILNDQQRSHFQKWLLIRLGWINPTSAMASASAIDGKIVNDEGSNDSNLYFQLAVLDNWIKTDLSGAFDWVCQLPAPDSRQRALEQIVPVLAVNNPQDTLTRLNGLKPAPGEHIYELLFQRWAANDPVQAITLQQQLPDRDQANTILCAIMKVWVNEHPDAAWDWVKSQPSSGAKNQALTAFISELAKTDIFQTLRLIATLPENAWRKLVMTGLFNEWVARDPQAAKEFASQHPELSGATWGTPVPWTTFQLNSNFGWLTEKQILLNATNEPAQLKREE